MAKKANSPKASGRKGKISPKMANPRFSHSKEKRGKGPIGRYLSEMDTIAKAQETYVLVDEIDLRYPEPSRTTTKGKRFWGRPKAAFSGRHTPLRECQKHGVYYYDMCHVCAQERFEGETEIEPTHMWSVGQLQTASARRIKEVKYAMQTA